MSKGIMVGENTRNTDKIFACFIFGSGVIIIDACMLIEYFVYYSTLNLNAFLLSGLVFFIFLQIFMIGFLYYKVKLRQVILKNDKILCIIFSWFIFLLSLAPGLFLIFYIHCYMKFAWGFVLSSFFLLITSFLIISCYQSYDLRDYCQNMLNILLSAAEGGELKVVSMFWEAAGDREWFVEFCKDYFSMTIDDGSYSYDLSVLSAQDFYYVLKLGHQGPTTTCIPGKTEIMSRSFVTKLVHERVDEVFNAIKAAADYSPT